MDCSWLTNFCNSTFWNTSLSWNTSHPDLTVCFEQTVLLWTPCTFLWLFSGLEIYYYLNSRTRRIPWNRLNIIKFILALIICICVVCKTVFQIDSKLNNKQKLAGVDVFSPILEFITILLACLHMELNRRMGLRRSGVLFIYWLLSVICSAPKIYTMLNKNDLDIYEETKIFQFAITIILMFLHCFVDYPPSYYGYIKSKKPSPEEESSFLSRILFSWFTPMAWKGYKNPLETKDLWDLRIEDMTKYVVPLFNHHWENSQSKCSGKKVSILPAIIKSFGLTNLMAAFLKLIQDTLTFVSPVVLRWLITFVNSDEEVWKGFFYVVILYSACSIQTIILSQYFYKTIIIGVQIRSALISVIYRKALKISSYSRKDTTVGEIVNLMAVDTQKFVDLLPYFNLVWSAPYQIIFSCYLLWKTLGISVLSGILTLIILIPINAFIIDKIKQFQIKQMKYKDDRVKVTNEVFSGIKILKLYAWEPNFENVIGKIRAKELSEMRKAAFMNAGTNFIWTCAPFLVSFVTFATYVFIDENNVLDANKAFTCISLFNILRFPMSMLPTLLSNMAQTVVSLRRINDFLNLPDLDPENVTHNINEDYTLFIENGEFSWGNQIILSNINLEINKGSLTGVVGQVGSGKSSLISAFLGEMNKIQGSVNTIGTIAYVSQQAWIQNATIRNNILFGRKYNEKYYREVIEACALVDDFQMLPAGDQTEIGEKGINLSGGQKQRVNLARAVYAKCDIYLLDDPLSAVDCHVAKHLFKMVIGPEGLLKKKTRILTTHSLHYLPYMDQILVLSNGTISEKGTYMELVKSRGTFAEFLEQYMKQSDGGDNICIDEIASPVSVDILAEKLERISQDKADLSTSLKDVALSKNSSFRARLSSAGSILEFDHTLGQLTEVERVETGNVNLKVYKQYIKSIGIILCFVILISDVVYQVFSISSSFWLSKWSDSSSTMNDNKKEYYLGVYGLLGIGQGLSSFLLSFAFAQGFYQSSVKAHQMLLKSCLYALQSFFDTTPLGRILNRFSNDLYCMDITLPTSIYQAVTTFFVLAGTLFVISFNFPAFLIIIVFISFAYIYIQRVYQATSRQLKRMESVSRSPIYSFFSETLNGTSTIRAFNQQERFILESDGRLDSNQKPYFYGLVANRWLAVRLESIANLIILCSALFTVIGKNSMTPGIVGLTVSYALQITQTLNWLVRMISDVETNIVAIERIKDYSEAPQEAPYMIEETKPSESWPEEGRVELKNYSVRYRPNLDLVLKNIDVRITGGEKIGIVGRTGAGKSSLTLCLFRIIEAAEGSIFIDDVDISKIGLYSLRSKITIIPQDAVLFSGTLRMNLDPYDKHSDLEVWTALEHAHLKEYISERPNGLLHVVTEGGENFSIGQRQLICLSRALLRKTKVFILDEATAAVDLQTDELIQKTIRKEFKECTILTIAHRLNTIMDYDRVIVLDKGCIAEFGSPQNLIEQKRIFYSMCKEAKLI